MACHGTPYGRENSEFWNTSGRITEEIEGLSAIISDLNDITDDQEKFGGRPVWRKKLFLKSFLRNSGGIDLGFVRMLYIWNNGGRGLACI